MILAQATEGSGGGKDAILPMQMVWTQITSLSLIEALTFISFGIVCLFYGWRVFKVLVVISFALIGLGIGVWANEVLVGGNKVWFGIICMVLFSYFSIHLMRWGVSALGAAAGGILTGGGWYAAGLPEQYIWAGAVIGFIAGGMISFIIFKAAVMLFTSFGGSGLVVVGVLAIIYNHMDNVADVESLVFGRKWFLPLMLLVPMGFGMFMQNKFIKGAQDWSV